MSEPTDAAKRAWQNSGAGGTDSAASIRLATERRMADWRRQTLRFWGSAAIIVPSWIAAWWWFPDLRPLAGAGLIVAAALTWHVYRRGPFRRPRANAGLPCLAHERELLSRERDFHRAMPVRFFLPVIAGQVAIVATLLSNSRFNNTPMFAAYLTLFVVTAAGILIVAFRRARRMVAELDRALRALEREAV